MAQRLQGLHGSVDMKYQEWLARALPGLAAVQIQQPADQAAERFLTVMRRLSPNA